MTKAIIMAGGEGTRLRPLTCNRPKPMIPVMNKPVIEHAVNLLKRHNITDIIISLFYLPENIQNYFGDGSEWDVNISYSVEETPLGTAGGVKQAMGGSNDTFVILSGDGIIDFDITEIINFHNTKSSPFTIVLNHVSKPTEYGIVITREDGTIDKFLEKPSWSEVFSDTANTGMYVINPKIIGEYIPDNTKYDFSFDLFPQLQENKIPLYGYIAEGYWCDVGNLSSYTDVHTDILEGFAKIDFSAKQIKKGVWAGQDADIHPEAVIKGPVFIGNYVRIKKNAEVSEYSVIGDNCIIEENASLRKTIVLHSTVIGPRCELRGAVIGKRCVIQESVSIYEGSVVSDDCIIGTNVTIPAGIRVWPDKDIDNGTTLTSDLIWGTTEKKSLFSSEGITGTFNVKITPEFASKLGSAIGAFLGKNTKLVISRDSTSAARLIKRAFTAGLLSMGVHVYDMEVESVPINRYSTRFLKADMGCYIQISPLTGLQYIQIRLFNKYGFEISLAEEKKIENIFYRGDYPRKDAYETGELIYATHHIDSYISNAENYINEDVIMEKKWSVIVDCFYGTSSHVFPELLTAYGCESTVIRGQIKEIRDETNSKMETRKALQNVTKMASINREIGIIIGPHATIINIIDELGSILAEDDIISILIINALKHQNAKKIYIPVTASNSLVKLIETNGGKVIRTSSQLKSPEDKIYDIMMENNENRYPYLEIHYDPMITFLKILMFLSIENTTLYEVKEQLPKSNIINTSLICSTNDKAIVMRMLSTSTDQNKIELIEGIKIIDTDSWVLILPDATEPLIHLYIEADTIELRDQLLDEYTIKIKKFIATLHEQNEHK